MERVSDSNTRPVNLKKKGHNQFMVMDSKTSLTACFSPTDIPPEIRGDHWHSPHYAESWNTEQVEKASGEAKGDSAWCLGKLKTWLLSQYAFLQIHRMLWDIIYTQTASGIATQNCRT